MDNLSADARAIVIACKELQDTAARAGDNGAMYMYDDNMRKTITGFSGPRNLAYDRRIGYYQYSGPCCVVVHHGKNVAREILIWGDLDEAIEELVDKGYAKELECESGFGTGEYVPIPDVMFR